MQSRRCLRVAENIRQVISKYILFKLDDSSLAHIWISGVEVSSDLKNAFIWYRLYQDQEQKETLKSVAASLQRFKSAIRRELARELRLKFVPDLKFYFDKEGESRDRVLRFLYDPSSSQLE